MLPSNLNRPPETGESSDFTAAVNFVRSVARSYEKNPLVTPAESITLSNGAVLKARFIDSYTKSAGMCFRADWDLPVEGEVKRVFEGHCEIYLNVPNAKQMVAIRMEKPASEELFVSGARDGMSRL